MRDTLTPLLSDSTRPTRGRLRRLFGVVLAVLATVAFLVPPAGGSSAAADEWPWDVAQGEDSDLLPQVGEINLRGVDGEPLTHSPYGIGVDSELGVAVFVGDDREIFLVDTQTLEQTVIPVGDEHAFGIPIKPKTGTAALDPDNHRLIMIDTVGGQVPGEEAHGCPGLANFACAEVRSGVPAVTIIDLTGGDEPVTRMLDLPGEADQQLLTPMDYHAPTGDLYIATESGTDSNPVDPPTLHEVRVSDLLAVDADAPVPPAWSYQLESCPSVSESGGGHVARGRQGDFVTVACEGDDVRPHGILRLDISAGGRSSETSEFRATFDPFVGDMADGTVSGNDQHDLVLVTSVLFGPRLFVYDAYRRAWTGAVELSWAGGKNQVPAASHPETARTYVFSASAGMLRVTEAAWPAVPNSVGRQTDHDVGVQGSQNSSAPLVDPATDRIFAPDVRMCLEEDPDGTCTEEEDKNAYVRVFEDRISDRPAPAIHSDYDAGTSDLAEEPGVATSVATGNARAFGARHLFVGGTANATFIRPEQNNATKDHVRSAPAGPGTRDTLRGQVLGANLSRISSPSTAAEATGLHIADQQTGQDLKRNTDVRCGSSRLASRAEQSTDCLSDDWQSDEPGEFENELHRRWDGSSWPDEFPEEMRGRSAYCDDFGGDPSEEAKPGSAVVCDSEVPQVSAGALFSPSQEDAGNDTPGLHVGYAESSTDIHEDESLGMVAMASAVARDVDLFGQVSIGEVRTEATAAAHGRPGTASTELVREYRQVRIGDFACGWQDDDPCDLYEVAHQINQQLGPRVVARVPAQDTFLNPDAGDEPDAQTGAARVSNGTPGGAKALVTLDPYQFQSGKSVNNDTRSELPGLQITVYHDSLRTSRQILQLAAVELDATYQISPVPTWDPPDWGSGDGTGGDDGLDLDGGLPDPSSVGGAATRNIVPPPPFVHLSQDPPPTSSDGDSPPTTGGVDEGAGFDGGDGAVSQGDAPSLGTADAPTVNTGDGVPAPEVASDSSGEQPVAAQDTQGGASGPGGLMLTRQRMGETVPLAVLWVLAALPFYLAVRRRRLTASAPRT